MRSYYVYILSSSCNAVLYVGVTSNIERRLFEHRYKLFDGFSSKYNLHKLVLLEETNDVKSAIAREKQLKGWSRVKKKRLIEKMNPYWNDLSDETNRSLHSS